MLSCTPEVSLRLPYHPRAPVCSTRTASRPQCFLGRVHLSLISPYCPLKRVSAAIARAIPRGGLLGTISEIGVCRAEGEGEGLEGGVLRAPAGGLGGEGEGGRDGVVG